MPTKDEIRQFVEILNALSRFEAEHRARCGWGAWTEAEQEKLPFPEAVKVTAWLRTLAEEVEDA
jgi:hypothetical protein